MQVDGDVIPVVALDRWVDLGARAADNTDDARILVLRDAKRGRLAVAVDGLLGVEAVPASRVQRIHRDEQPDELFDSAIAGNDAQAEPVWLLEAGRLIRLASVWREDAGIGTDAPAGRKAAADDGRAGAAARGAVRYAVFEVGAAGTTACYAIAAAAVERVVPTPKAESTLQIGRRSCGVTTWDGRKLPMLDLAAVLGVVATGAPCDWMAVAVHGGMRMGLCVKAARQLVDLRAEAIRAAADEPLMVGRAIVDGLGTVRVIDLDTLAAAAPELVIGGRLNDGRPAAATAAQTRPRGKPHIVFGVDRDYATPVDGIVGIVALAADAAASLAGGGSAVVRWREKTVRVANMPAIGASPSAAAPPEPREPHFAVLVKTGAADSDIVGIAVHKLSSWLPAQAAHTSTMRVGASGDLNMVTRTEDGRRESLVVVQLQEMAYLLS